MQALRTLWERYVQPQRDSNSPVITSVHDIVKSLGIPERRDGVRAELESCESRSQITQNPPDWLET